jgi:transketolase|tara:strand:+ start:7574 stop:9397 length:1824 start_codon:yes stop_codon:yes gene_type:complete
MNIKGLQELANIMRRDVLKMTNKAESGHPTTCLSSAEIMSVLFFNEMKYDTKNSLNPDNDEFILSKGHAAPILYSALYHSKCIKNDLMKLRELNSPLEGHPLPKSLNWIKVATGSLGQGLSVGVGMALASKLQKRKFKTYVLIGDGESAEGEIYEALELGDHYKLNNLIAILDINRLGQTGESLLGHKIKNYEKKFKGFNWNTIVIDGHNIKQITKALSKAKNSKKPTIILAKTFKGNGVSFIENKEGWHGRALSNEELEKALKEIPNPKLPKMNIKKPKNVKQKLKSKEKLKSTKYNLGEEVSTREAYGNSLVNLSISNPKILAVDAGVSNSTFSKKLKKANKNKFVEAFIAEQNMAGMALGLSIKQFNVFASSFAAFLTRAADQIRMASLSSPKNLTFCGSHAGVSIGKDGASQMGLEDISMFRSVPKSILFYPSDAVSCEKLTILASKLNGLKYIRTTRSKTEVIYKNNEKFSLGDFKILKKSNKDKLVIVGSGITLHESLKAYEELKKKNKNVAVVDLYCIKPFNSKKFENFVKKHGNKLVVVEDHYKEGGIGEMLLEELANSGIKIKHLAVGEIPHSGEKKELLEKYKIDSKNIIKEINKFV